jgi:hypothetical protein
LGSRRTSDVVPFTEKSQGFAGGVNLRDAWSQLGPNEARVLENVVLDERGGAGKRLGSSARGTYGASADRTISMYTYYRGANPPQVLIHTSAGTLYYTTDPTASSVAWTQIATGLSQVAPMSFETFAGNCYFTNGVDSYAKWDGTTYTAFASAPKGKFIRLWKDTMFMAGVAGLADRVYESAAGDAETWPAASWVDIGKGDGDIATGLGSDGFTLIFFKRNRHMAITDPVTLANRVVDFEKGCESHFSVVQFEGYVYFLSRRGVCRYLGDSPSELVSGVLDPLFDPIILNLTALDKSWAYTYGNRIGWALPEVGSLYPTVQIEYYPRLGQLNPFGQRAIGPWSFNRMPARQLVRYRYLGNDILIGGAILSNKLMWLLYNVGTDDGSTFTAIAETGSFDFGAPTRTKYIRRIRVLLRGNLTMQLRRNFGTAITDTKPVNATIGTDLWSLSDLWGSGSWGPDSLYKEVLVNIDRYGRYFSLRFTDSSTDPGSKLIEVGSFEYRVPAGEWGIYQVVMDGNILGLR